MTEKLKLRLQRLKDQAKRERVDSVVLTAIELTRLLSVDVEKMGEKIEALQKEVDILKVQAAIGTGTPSVDLGPIVDG